jgi:hypothetical protein
MRVVPKGHRSSRLGGQSYALSFRDRNHFRQQQRAHRSVRPRRGQFMSCIQQHVGCACASGSCEVVSERPLPSQLRCPRFLSRITSGRTIWIGQPNYSKAGSPVAVVVVSHTSAGSPLAGDVNGTRRNCQRAPQAAEHAHRVPQACAATYCAHLDATLSRQPHEAAGVPATRALEVRSRKAVVIALHHPSI